MKNNRYSTYVNGDLQAHVVKHPKKGWGCEFYNNLELVKIEFYSSHSESYAEDAAENYVEGIKII